MKIFKADIPRLSCRNWVSLVFETFFRFILIKISPRFLCVDGSLFLLLPLCSSASAAVDILVNHKMKRTDLYCVLLYWRCRQMFIILFLGPSNSMILNIPKYYLSFHSLKIQTAVHNKTQPLKINHRSHLEDECH